METEIKKEYLGGYRKDIIKHELAAMEIACISAKESRDPSTQVGACILNSDNRVISTGFNHNPIEWDKESFPWRNDSKTIGEENTKYPYIIHAELDAISKCCNGRELRNGTIYVTLFPCIQCAKTIASFGIKKVVYAEYRESQEATCSKMLLEKCGIEIVSFDELVKDKQDDNIESKSKVNIKKRGE